jgi:peptidoglycan/xylan/chitin deacetylase (PgdA/CDA1 family)
MVETRKLVLSFDDGPEPVTALEGILTALRDNRITAEFFVLGSEVKTSPAGAARIVSEGHRIQNHTWSHPHLAEKSEAEIEAELANTQKIIKEKTGATATKLRPPYGQGGWPPFDPKLAKVAARMSLNIQNWDIDTRDWAQPKGIGAAKIDAIKQQFAGTRGKGVLNVLMHVQQETANDLPAFIAFLKQAAFTFAVPTD